ncbi:MAG: hypothetical protein KJ939_01495 [Nanoarchaeota archaeon]|nr:hypothetical protein [Nanoarchaeota archaeon]MBU4351734.1 hypothetical protein [Nanoarchaeota archaeon]MCG2719834.1 hypothetical protein [Nanoarchaeota archaeon]
MPLDPKTTKKINEFVYSQPRTIQEIAQLIKKNWRTADSYVKQISSQMGTISIKILRPGTRGAVKIVYWNSTDNINSTQAQELLMKKLEVGKTKKDFSPFDIYQYVPKKKRFSFFEDQEEENINVKQDLVGSLRKAKNQVLIFSGNLSWVTIKQGKEKMLDVFTELADKGIYIKVLTKVDITSLDNVIELLAINTQIGKDMMEVRHCEQPLRAFIVDNKFVKLKEIKDPKDYDVKKSKKTYIFYEIFDCCWIEWLQKVFWKFFASSIPAKRRIDDLRTVKRL